MNVDDRERYTGDICGDNCRGVQKPLRLAEYLAARGDRLDYDTSSSYGDSASDLNMLELCARQVGVNPKPKLRKALEGRKNAELVHWAPPEKE
ncbi:MAG: HAD family hydrolase [Lachnospiraceae bacterium]